MKSVRNNKGTGNNGKEKILNRNEVEKILERKRFRRKTARFSSFLAVVVALTTAGSMMLPAVTMTATAPDPAPDSAVVETQSADSPSLTSDMPAQTFEDKLDTLDIAISADAGAFPADTSMQLAPVQDIDALFDLAADTVESKLGAQIQYLEAIDIHFDNNGKEIEPALPVRVSVRSEQIADKPSPVILHMTDGDQAEILLPADDADAASLSDDEILFDATHFSYYLLAYPAEPIPFEKLQKAAAGNDDPSDNANEEDVNEVENTDVSADVTDVSTDVNEENQEPDAASDAQDDAAQSVEPAKVDDAATDGQKDNIQAADPAESGNDATSSAEAKYDGQENTAAGTQNDASERADKTNAGTDSAKEASEPADGTTANSKNPDAKDADVKGSETKPANAETNDSMSSEADTEGRTFYEKTDDEPQVTEPSISSVVSDALSRISIDFLTADGETYKITVAYDEKAGIPEKADLQVEELLQGTDNYNSCIFNTAHQLFMGTEDISFARFFDITIIDENGEKVEPKTTVQVAIRYKDSVEIGEDQALSIVHFAQNGTEIISDVVVSDDGKEISYTQSSFSVTGTIVTPTDVLNANHEATLAMVVEYDGKYYTVDNDGYLTETKDYNSTSNTLSVQMPMLWTYHYEANAGTYIRHAALAKHIDPSSQVADQWYYRYIEPDEASGLITESGNDDFRNQAAITYDNNRILSAQNPEYGIGVTKDPETGKLRICGQSAAPVTIRFANVQDSVPVGNLPNRNTVNHIDISIEGDARIDVPLAYGKYYNASGDEVLTVSADNQKIYTLKEEVPITLADLKAARITAYTRDSNGQKQELQNAFYITGYSANSATEFSTPQVRIEGSFKVANVADYSNGNGNMDANYRRQRLNNRVYYNVAVTKTIEFTLMDENGQTLYRMKNNELVPVTIKADVTLTASFDYWDTKNECPPLQYYWLWQQGAIYGGDQSFWGGVDQPVSGMDFVLGGDADDAQAHISAVEITKILVDEQGNRIHPDEEVTSKFNIYTDIDGKTNSVVGLNVDKYECEFDSYNGAKYSDYVKEDTQTLTVGENGLGSIYDYDINEGMVYIDEDKNSIKQSIKGHLEDEDQQDWTYRNTYIVTEYVWRKNGDQGTTHLSKTYTSADEAYRSIPEVLGAYKNAAGGSEWNGFLEFYVYNVYNTDKTDIQAKKRWEGMNENGNNVTFVVNGETITYNKGDLRVVMELEQYKDGVKQNTLEGVAGDVPTTITLDGVKDDPQTNYCETEPWVFTWKDLPSKSTDGQHQYTYKLVEKKVYLNSDSSGTDLLKKHDPEHAGTHANDPVFTQRTSEDGMTIINTPVSSPIDVTIKKYWQGGDAKSGAKVEATLGRYKLVEGTASSSATANITTNVDSNGKVTSALNNPDQTAPAAPDYLSGWHYAVDSEYNNPDVAIIQGDSWAAKVEGLPSTDADGHPYAYFIKSIVETGTDEGTVPAIELENNGRTMVFSIDNKRDLLVTNTLPTYKDITVRKVWKDDKGQEYDGNWPNDESLQNVTIKFYLVKNGDVQQDKYVEISKDKQSDKFTQLPVTDSAGHEISYTVQEEQVSSDSPLKEYTAQISQLSSDGVITVTNAKNVKGRLQVEKKWRGVPDATGFPDITFTLYQGKMNGSNGVSTNNGDYWEYNPDGTHKYSNIALGNSNNWIWTCPDDLPTQVTKNGTTFDVGYFVMENGLESDYKTFVNNRDIKAYYYTNSKGGSSQAMDHPGSAGLGKDDESQKIEGTLYIHNRVTSYKQLQITKQDFYTYDQHGKRVKVTDQYKKDVVMGVRIIRRAKLNNNTYSEWEDYGDEMFVGYNSSGQPVVEKGNNDFSLTHAGTWFFKIEHQDDEGDPNSSNHKVALPGYGYYKGQWVEFQYNLKSEKWPLDRADF